MTRNGNELGEFESEDVGFELCADLLRADFLEVACVEVPRVVDEHIDVPETGRSRKSPRLLPEWAG